MSQGLTMVEESKSQKKAVTKGKGSEPMKKRKHKKNSHQGLEDKSALGAKGVK